MRMPEWFRWWWASANIQPCNSCANKQDASCPENASGPLDVGCRQPACLQCRQVQAVVRGGRASSAGPNAEHQVAALLARAVGGSSALASELHTSAGIKRKLHELLSVKLWWRREQVAAWSSLPGCQSARGRFPWSGAPAACPTAPVSHQSHTPPALMPSREPIAQQPACSRQGIRGWLQKGRPPCKLQHMLALWLAAVLKLVVSSYGIVTQV